MASRASIGSRGTNHVGNLCDAPELVDIATGAVRYQHSFYYLGHFSRFVRRGARRMVSTGGPADLQSVAFVNPDSSAVMVVLNAADTARDFSLAIGGAAVASRNPAHAIQAYVGARR